MANNTTSLGFNVFARNLASRTFKKVADDADGLGARLDRAAGTMVKAGAGLSTFTPLLSGAVAAAGSLAAPLVAATAGAGALAAVAVPAFTDISDAMALQERAANGSEAAARQLEEQLAEMSPAARTLMKDWQGLTEGYNDWAKSLQPDVLPLFSRGIDMVSGRLTSLNPLVRGSAGAVDNLLDSLDAALKDPFWDQFGERMTRLAPQAIEGLGRSGGNVTAGLAGIVNAFVPYAPGMLRLVEDISRGFASWGMGLDGSPAFQKFMDYVASRGPQILEIIRNLSSVMGMLIAGLQPFVGLAPLLTGTLSVLSSMLAQVDPDVLESIGTAVGGIVIAWKLWTGAQWALNAAMAANPIGLVILGLVALGAGLVLAWKKSETFRSVVTETWSKVQAGARRVSDFFSGTVWPVLVDGWQELADAVRPAATALLGWLRDLRDGSSTFSGIWSTLWDGAQRKVGIVWDAIGPIAAGGFDILTGSLRLFTAVFTGDWDTAWEETKGILSSAFSAWKRITRTQLALWWSTFQTWFVELPASVRDWMAETVPVIRTQLREWGTEFVDWAREMGPVLVKRLQATGTEIGVWITTDMPPLLRAKVAEWTKVFINWAKELPERIRKWIGDGKRLQALIVEWGPKLAIGLTAAIAIMVLAIPTALALVGAMFLIVLASIAREVHTYLVAAATEWVLGVSEELRLGVEEMVGWFRSLPTRVTAYFLKLHSQLVDTVVPGTVAGVITWFGQLPAAVTGIFARMTSGALTQTGALRDGVVSRSQDLRSRALGALKLFATGAASAFALAVKGIGKAWGQIESIAKKPIRFAIQTVYNRGIVPLWNKIAARVDGISKLDTMSLPKGFARGGVLAGSSTWRQGDDQIIRARKGEGIAVSEAMRVPELRGELLRWNAIGVSGGTSALRQYAKGRVSASPGAISAGQPPYDGFARGGIVGSALASSWDSIAGSAKEWATKPLSKLTDALAGQFGKGNDFGGIPYHMFKQVSGAMLTRFGKADSAYAASMAGGADSWSGLASASTRLRKAANFARAQHGKPYIWGGAGPRGYDCSGFMGAIENVIRGVGPYFRRYSTHAFRGNSAPPGWQRNAKSPFTVGITHGGVGHTAGTLMGVDVESRGSVGAVVGSRARGARNPLFSSVYGFTPVAGDKSAGHGKKAAVFDRGGVVPPGLSVIDNRTGHPEELRRADYLDDGPRELHLHFHGPVASERQAEDMVVKGLREAERKGRVAKGTVKVR